MVSAALLAQLRHYWQRYHPQDWLFPNSNTPRLPLTMSTAQKVFKKAKEATGIQKIGGIHSLRHAYATHQLQSGLPVYTLQQQLGHSDIHSTMHYVHWVAQHQSGVPPMIDLIEQLGVGYE